MINWKESVKNFVEYFCAFVPTTLGFVGGIFIATPFIQGTGILFEIQGLGTMVGFLIIMLFVAMGAIIGGLLLYLIDA